jgi:hypothetical protein
MYVRHEKSGDLGDPGSRKILQKNIKKFLQESIQTIKQMSKQVNKVYKNHKKGI